MTIRDTGQADTIAGQLIEAVDGVGPAELVLQGVSSGVDNPEELRITALEKATMNLWEQARTVAETSDRRVCQLLEAQAGGAEQHHGQSGISFEKPVIRPVSAEIPREVYSGVAINPGTIQEDHWVTGVFLMTPTGQEPGEECGGP